MVAVSSDVEHGIREDRIAKVEAMRRAGVDPYPARTPPRVDVATVRAEHTGTFLAVKAGFVQPEARAWTGEVHLLDIGLPRRYYSEPVA